MHIGTSIASSLSRASTALYDAVRSAWDGNNRTKARSGEPTMARMVGPGGVWGYPNGWSAETLEQVRHFRLWPYIAIRAIAEHTAMHPPHLAHVVGPAEADALAGTPRSKRFLGRYERNKAVTASAQQHETLEAVDSTHPLLRLLRNPNGPDVGYTFWYSTATSLELTGKAYWWKVRPRMGSGMPPVELWHLLPQWVRPVAGKNRIVDSYQIRPYGTPTTAGGGFEVDADDIVEFRYPSPLSMTQGWSPLFAGAEWVDTSQAIDTSRWYLFENGAWSSLFIELDKDVFGRDPPKQSQIDRFYAQLAERTKGRDKHGRPLIMAPGMKATEGMRSPPEMGFVESGDQLREWTLALYRVSKVVAGMSDDVNYNTALVHWANFFRGTMAPKQSMLGQIATERLAREYDDSLIVYWPDQAPTNPADRRADCLMRFQTQAASPNEIRREFGMDDWPLGGNNPVDKNGLPVEWAEKETVDQPIAPTDLLGLDGGNGTPGRTRQTDEPRHRAGHATRNGRAARPAVNGKPTKQ